MGPLYELEQGAAVRAGVLVVGAGSVPARPLWELLQRFSRRTRWLLASFSLQSRPQCHGVARADGQLLLAGFAGVWTESPRFTLVLADRTLRESVVRAQVRRAFIESITAGADDPFPCWRPGDPPTALLDGDGRVLEAGPSRREAAPPLHR